MRASVGVKSDELGSLSEARSKKVELDWDGYSPCVPAQLGVHSMSVSIDDVIPYINWTFFFHAWKLGGKFAGIANIHGCDSCRAMWLTSFPEEERAKASEAMQLHKEALRLLNRLSAMKADYCRALYGFFPAHSEGDDLVINSSVRIPTLRQQAKREDGVYKSLADYVMPETAGKTDYVGAFAVTGGFGSDKLKEEFEAEGDTYNTVLLQTLTDRLAEATAEYLHEKVRKQYWGYAPDEDLTVDEMFKVKYKGIRPAVGYPSLPDQKLNFVLDELLDFSRIGISLTENGAMLPTAAVSGLYIAHPESSYFMIGTVSEEQMKDYAGRRNMSEDEVRGLLVKNLEMGK